MKVFCNGLAILKELKKIGLLYGCRWGECLSSYLIGQLRKWWIDSVNDWFEEKSSECWATKKDGV